MFRMFRRTALAAIGLFLSLSPPIAAAADQTWPRELGPATGRGR